jgi:hypothetical protein
MTSSPPSTLPAEYDLREYGALRDTIRQRGTIRIVVFVFGLGLWAAVAVATAVFWTVPAATLFPLVVLGGVFEGVFALHVGAERIGRYLQVFHADRWEETSMAFGVPLAGTGSDPLFAVLFAVATILNFAPVTFAGAVAVEVATLGAAHAALLLRLLLARRAAFRQRAADLERFRQLAASRR